MTASPCHLYTIPAGANFAESFAAKLLQQTKDSPEKLTEILVLLPTRRACRIVREAFLRQSGGVAMLLPRLQTIGDIDEDALALEIAALSQAGADGMDIPPAMPVMRRRVLLTRLILQRPDYADNPDQALALADALGQLLDRIHTEGLDMADLPGLVDDTTLADRWKITLKFLEIILHAWPEILAAEGYIDMADRRNRLLHRLADHWQAHPPAHPIYAAGSTGSIPATGRLLRVIAALPDGHVILPGLDRGMDPASWDAVTDTHPQATLKNLLQQFNLRPQDVPLWNPDAPGPARNDLAREIMRPAATSGEWRSLSRQSDPLAAGLSHLQRIDCASSEEEAALIALIFRHVQHQRNKTATLVTFDRGLARRVAGACARFGVVVDDSAGQFLSTTPIGGFLSFCAEACITDLAPVPLLSLLKHSHAAAGMESGDFRAAVRRLDLDLRGLRPAPGFAGLRAHVQQIKPDRPVDPGVLSLLAGAEAALTPLLALTQGRHPFKTFITAHLQAAEAIATSPTKAGRDRLWGAEDGETAATFFADLTAHAHALPAVTGPQYLRMLATLMQGVQVRPRYGMHPRLSILGPMEARMLTADLVILGGLNEGSWPGIPENDPWMSRPMRSNFGLPSPERGIGLSAHDFVQGFCAGEVFLTRSQRAGAAPTIPSRWLQRLEAVLQAANLRMVQSDWLDKVRELDKPAETIPFLRPEPRPPTAKRPVRLSVTEIETWMRDPYSLYAKRVLNLYKIDSVDENMGAADRGTILHEILETFVRTYKDSLPDQAYEQLMVMGTEILDRKIGDVRTRHFWGVRFEKLAVWFIDQENEWRTKARPTAQEIKGEMLLPDTPFTLSGKADRIDTMLGGGMAIIDYKTGAVPRNDDILLGLSPQLPLEAAMIQAGAFPGIPPSSVAYLGHWLLTGATKGGVEKNIKKIAADDLGEQALTGLTDLVRVFNNDATPYYSLPRPSARPRHNDYAQLARVQEWSVLDDVGGEE